MSSTGFGFYVDSPDEILERLAQQADPTAFSVLVERHHSKSYRMAWSILRNDADAEEAVQEAVLNAWKHIGRFEANARFATWFVCIVKNQCLMKLRSARRMQVTSIDGLDRVGFGESSSFTVRRPDPERELQQREIRLLLRTHVSRMPSIYRDALTLLHYEEMPPAAVAEHLGLTLSALKSRACRARRELRSRFENLESQLPSQARPRRTGGRPQNGTPRLTSTGVQ